MSIEDIAEFLMSPELTGAMGRKILSKEQQPFTFFQPFSSKTDVLLRATSIVTAPATFSLITLAAAIDATIELLQALYYLCQWNLEDASEHAGESAEIMYTTLLMIALATISPIVNLVDFIGSIYNTFMSPEPNNPVKGTNRFTVITDTNNNIESDDDLECEDEYSATCSR